MYKWRPSKWLPWSLVGAGLPWLAATFITTEDLKNDVLSRATAAVTASESTSWATLSFDGRDATVAGTATSQAAVDAAVSAVRGTYGIRTVGSVAQVVEPVRLSPPVVESFVSDSATPVIKGTYGNETAKTLAVTVAGTTYKLGQNPELTADGPNWTLALAAPLADGDYDVSAEVSDGDKQTVASAAPGKLTVKLPPPPDTTGPTAPALTTSGGLALAGTFDEADTASFSATLDGREYVLNRGAALTSDGAGNFSFAPSRKLVPGSYDVDFKLADKVGNVTAFKAEKAFVVPEPAAAPPPAASAADSAGPAAPVLSVSGQAQSLSGTFDEADTKFFSATLDGREYVLNRGAALTSDGKGNFVFAPSRKLAPGSHDVDFKLVDGAGNVTTQKVGKAIVVPDAVAAPAVEQPTAAADVPPPAPTVSKAVAASATPQISGTWPQGEAQSLTVTVGGTAYELGKDAALTSDAAGNWTLTPSQPLKDGIYDVVVSATNAAGAATRDLSVAELEVDTAGPAAPALDPVAEGTSWPYALTGTFNQADTSSFSATVDGREYILGRGAALTSDAPGKFTFAPARKFAPGSYNVEFKLADKLGNVTQTVAENAIVVAAPPPPPVPPAPTVQKLLDLTGKPNIRGTWPVAEAKTLEVSLGGHSYVLGRDSNLRADAKGNWRLIVTAPLKDGIYDVVATATNAAGISAKDVSVAELEVEATPPAKPTIESYAGDKAPPALKGTWDEAKAKTLKVEVPALGINADLGAAASPLTSDGSGNWTLSLSGTVDPGVYEVYARSSDRHGRIQDDGSAGELTVAAAGQASAAPAYDCTGVLERISSVFPLRFTLDAETLDPKYEISLSQYAALLKDPRCVGVHIELSGHADERGSPGYNLTLSENRAAAITKLLEQRGIEANRLTFRGYGETMPISTERTREGYAINRRVEVTVTKR